MSNFYIEDQDDNIYEITVVTDVDINYSSDVTDFPVESGFSVSDNTTLSPVTLTYKGMISNILNVNNLTDTSDVTQVIRDIVALRNSRNTFTVYYDNRADGIDSLPALDNCVFTSLKFTRGSGDGYSYQASFSVKQIIVSEQSELIEETVRAPDDYNQTASEVNKGSNSTKQVTLQESSLLVTASTLGGGE